MNLKTFIILVIVLLILLCGGLIAYKYLDSDFTQIGRQISSADGHYTVSVPLKWEKTVPASAHVLLSARSMDQDMYLQVSVDADSSSESSLEEHVNEYIKTIGQKSDDRAHLVTVVSPKSKKINGLHGYYFELETTCDDMEIHIWSFCYPSSSGFIHLDVTAPRNETENDADIANGIINSLTTENYE